MCCFLQLSSHKIIFIIILYGCRKKQKSCNINGYDPDEEYNNHVTMDTEPSFQRDAFDINLIPLTHERRSNSTSQILQLYKFDEDETVSPV